MYIENYHSTRWYRRHTARQERSARVGTTPPSKPVATSKPAEYRDTDELPKLTRDDKHTLSQMRFFGTGKPDINSQIPGMESYD